ncbi:MAG: lipid-A-disaccharide synthase [Candidatus Omnitrophica bacterium]|nr:lipid-A-disaccharide synthase [Candidatus Omnitrophota bacterium]MBU2044185.1 lipid-A-disaccharide synthase [Candidatus Omnitrophota bacterium]MBU2251739.1 lipid-A-disaccharide synthase [Candidatus Omnitrophota bacterium]
MKKIVIVAGDTSGDIYGGLLSKNLKQKYPSLEIYSFGGPALAKHSRQIINLLQHSVCGLVEVLSSLKTILATFEETLRKIKEIKPDLVILIDFPDFNLRLAKKINKQYPVFYYVSPQVWAWRKKRIKLIKKFIDKMVVIFKFEEDFYKRNNMDVLYFGHPLLEIIQPLDREPKKIISFLPGSRKNELKKHLPIMREAKKIIQQRLPEYGFQIIKPASLDRKLYEQFYPDMEIVEHSYAALEESKFIITSSGTATVEIAILGIPYLIIYKINPLSWQILKRMVKTKFVGMVNILAGKKVVDELLQKDANPQRISEVTCGYLENEAKYSQLKEELKNLKEILYPYGASVGLADYIGRYLKLPAL